MLAALPVGVFTVIMVQMCRDSVIDFLLTMGVIVLILGGLVLVSI